MKEVHLFIIWENAQYKKDEIISDIKRNFRILKMYSIKWSEEMFSTNLSRFYGDNLPKGCGKEQHCGTGRFILIVVEVYNPIYEERQTSKGTKIVNVQMFDKKSEYRLITGGGHKVHATNSEEETNHDLTLLLGMNVKDFLEKERNFFDENKIEELEQDLIGSNSWRSVDEIFYCLNNCTKYAILRNYESLPEELYVNEHSDIDLICNSHTEVAYILNAKKVFEEEYRVHYSCMLQDKEIFWDLRYIGDNYYVKEFEEELLKTRVLNEKRFYTVNDELYYYSLLYHAILHKKEFADDYKQRLDKMKPEFKIKSLKLDDAIKILQNWLIQKEFIITIPDDKSVLFNISNANKFSKLLYRNEEKIKELSIINNELNDKISSVENERNKKEEELNKVYNSKSWKVTEILRKISGKLKKRN